MIVFAAIMPHPPESIPGIGTREDFSAIKKTLDSFEQLREGLEKATPDTVIVISPHADLESFSFAINSAETLIGNFTKFGLDQVQEYGNDIEFVDRIAFECSMCDIPAHLHENFLDHGAMIPLFHLLKNYPQADRPKVVHLAFSLMDYQRHYRYGQVIQDLINKNNGRRVAVIASADLSHRLDLNSPAGYSPTAKDFDREFVRYLGSNDLVSIMNLHEDITRQAAECGIRSIIILLGALHGKQYKFNLLCYESPFGIGYLTARLL